ncbi:hypothetical protein Ccrd_005570 [Cynara cardunculus var. scolymus]|uniref:Uncharacterized protein n=1 Tax=Cynara cardunculus var. scolymus TaxID=59895 RepID=A0A103XKF8_CYNCS|nr:hypothetical protein Ccrd_005570 [Cynara cardunculus var. scolymus]
MDTTNDFNSIIIIEGRLSTSSECSSTSSLSDQEHYTQATNSVRRSQKWRKLLKKVVKESKKSIYGSSKPLMFQYDAVSYSLNFDEGNHGDEYC